VMVSSRMRNFNSAFAWSRKSPVRFAMFVHLSALITASSTRRISMKFDIWNSYEKSVEKFQIWLKSVENIGRFTRSRKYVLFLPAALNRHKNSLSECYDMRPLG